MPLVHEAVSASRAQRPGRPVPGPERHADGTSTRSLHPAVAGDHLDRLYRAAWGLCGNREAAEDLVQETYLRILSRPRVLRRDEALPYLLRALRNTFISGRRRARPTSVPLTAAREPSEVRPALLPHQAAEAAELLGAVGELPAELRDATIAIDLVGLSYEEAAGSLGLRTGTVKSRVHRARRALAERFRRSTRPAAGDNE